MDHVDTPVSLLKKMSEKKMIHRKKVPRKGCVDGCCKPPPFDGNYCMPAFPSNTPVPSYKKPVKKPDTLPAPTNTGVKVTIAQEETKDKNDKKDDTVVEKTNIKKVDAVENDNIKKDGTIENNNIINDGTVENSDIFKDDGNTQSLNSKQGGQEEEPIHNVTFKEANPEYFCTEKCCAKLHDGKSCTDANCSGCDGNHGSAARNTFLGIAGILILAMIGYLSYIKMKTRRAKVVKNVSSSDSTSKSIKV